MTSATTAPARTARPRRLVGAAAIGAGILALGAIGVLVTGPQWSERDALDPESAGPAGTRALVRILAEHGVDVRVARDLPAAQRAVTDGATLVLPDAPFLSDDTLRELAASAGDVVLVEPRSRTLDLLVGGSSPGGAAPRDALEPGCAADVAARAGAISVESLYVAGDGVAACYPADGGSALLLSTTPDGTVAAVDGRALLANDALATEGNAALALGLTGRNAVLVWYVPSLADAGGDARSPTLGELTAPWVTPAMALLIVAALAAAIWRGRRFGPLVAENLPVTVRASETTVGRARLYARSGDADHAIAHVRIGALERMGRALGLGPHAGAAEIADAAAARLGADRAQTRDILLHLHPHSDRELVELAARVRAVEANVHAAVRPERNTP